MKSCPFHSYLWKKNIFQQLSIAHKKQIQLSAKHKHDKALQWGIKTSHVEPGRGRSSYWRTVTPISKHKMSVQPATVEQCQASPWWARRKAEMAFPGKSCNCCCSGTLLQAGSSSSPNTWAAPSCICCLTPPTAGRNCSEILEWTRQQRSLQPHLLRWLRENNCR